MFLVSGNWLRLSFRWTWTGSRLGSGCLGLICCQSGGGCGPGNVHCWGPFGSLNDGRPSPVVPVLMLSSCSNVDQIQFGRCFVLVTMWNPTRPTFTRVTFSDPSAF